MSFLFLLLLAESSFCSPTYLPQNWTPEERKEFYELPQGSHIMPFSWAMALKGSSETPFFSSKNLKKFGYLPQPPSPENPYALPVGFTKDGKETNPQLGINCAACHTVDWSIGGKNIRVDGGAALVDFQSFVRSLDEALEATLADPKRFESFATALAVQDKNELRSSLVNLLQERKDWQTRNSSSLTYGPGRNDAFGVIFNQVLVKDLGVNENRRDPDAPVSYPVLWDTNHHNLVQWVGIASNNPEKGGSLSRNIGQVLGVFGHVNVTQKTKVLNGYCSSIRRTNLERLEVLSRKLWSPKWPVAEAGPINLAQAHSGDQSGKKIYESRCIQCHALLNRTQEDRTVRAVMIPAEIVGTDPKVATNASLRTAMSGAVQGSLLKLTSGRPLEREEPAALILKHVVSGTLAGSISPLTCKESIDTDPGRIGRLWLKVVQKMIGGLFDEAESSESLSLEKRIENQRKLLERYKARPLNGIWASAPYFHNGSIKSLKEMLLPAAQRSKTFRLGCNTFDPESVGIECSEGSFLFDTTLAGNSNAGHEYGTDLSLEEKKHLLEFLKTL